MLTKCLTLCEGGKRGNLRGMGGSWGLQHCPHGKRGDQLEIN